MQKLKKFDWRYLGLAFPLILYSCFYTILVRIFPNYHNIVIPFDAKIPFIEWFIFPYLSWFFYIVLILLRLFFTDKNTFIKTASFMICGMYLTALIGIFYPNTNDLRPTSFDHQNIATWMVGIMYHIDPPRMILPSIHVYNTMGLTIGAWVCDNKIITRKWKGIITIWGVLIILATMFIKQHSIVDVIAAFALGTMTYFIFFHGAFAKWIDRIEPIKPFQRS